MNILAYDISVFKCIWCLDGFIKLRPNDRNMSTQHITTLLGATCCWLQHVGCCSLKFDYFQTWAYNTQHVATWSNRAAKRAQQRAPHVAPNNAAICCADMWHRLAGALKVILREMREHSMLSLLSFCSLNVNFMWYKPRLTVCSLRCFSFYSDYPRCNECSLFSVTSHLWECWTRSEPAAGGSTERVSISNLISYRVQSWPLVMN